MDAKTSILNTNDIITDIFVSLITAVLFYFTFIKNRK